MTLLSFGYVKLLILIQSFRNLNSMRIDKTLFGANWCKKNVVATFVAFIKMAAETKRRTRINCIAFVYLVYVVHNDYSFELVFGAVVAIVDVFVSTFCMCCEQSTRINHSKRLKIIQRIKWPINAFLLWFFFFASLWPMMPVFRIASSKFKSSDAKCALLSVDWGEKERKREREFVFIPLHDNTQIRTAMQSDQMKIF